MSFTLRKAPLQSFLLFVLSVLSVQSSSAQDRITLGLTTRNGSTSLPFVIAEEKGFFKSEGLNAIVVIMQNQVVVNGVLSKNVDYGGTFSNFVGAAMAGLPGRSVMFVMDGSGHLLLLSPNINKRKEIQGKNVGV